MAPPGFGLTAEQERLLRQMPGDSSAPTTSAPRGLSIEEQMLEAERQARAERERAERARAAAERQRQIDAEIARFKAAQAAAEEAARQERARIEAERQRQIAEQLARFKAAEAAAAEAERQQRLRDEADRQRQIEQERARFKAAEAAEEAARQQRLRDEADRQRQIEAERARFKAAEAAAAETARQQQLRDEADRQRQIEEERARFKAAEAAAEEAARQDRIRAEAERQLKIEAERARFNEAEADAARAAAEAQAAKPRTPRLAEILSGELPPEAAEALRESHPIDAPSPATPSAPPVSDLERAAASFEEERDVRQRNDALRRAFEVVPGGPEARAAIEDLVAGSRSAPLAPRGTSGGAEFLVEERSRDRENREIASTLPMGRQAFDSFKRELDLEERNAALLREMVADPGGAAHVRRLQNLDAFRLEDPAARRSAFGREMVGEKGGAELVDARAEQVEALKLRLQDVVPEFGPQAPRRLPGLSDAEEALFEAALVDEEAAASPPIGVRHDLIDQVNAMFAVVGVDDPASLVRMSRPFSDQDINGFTAEQRVREIGATLGFSSAQLDRIVAGTAPADVGPPAGRFFQRPPTTQELRGAIALAEGREVSDVPVITFAAQAVGTFLDQTEEVARQEAERQKAKLGAARQALEFGVGVTERVLAEKADQIRDANDTFRKLGPELVEFGVDRLDDLDAITGRVKAFVETASDELLGLLDVAIGGGCLARERVHQTLLGFVMPWDFTETDPDKGTTARMVNGAKGIETFDGENNQWDRQPSARDALRRACEVVPGGPEAPRRLGPPAPTAPLPSATRSALPVSERNAPLRRAFEVVPGGPEARAMTEVSRAVRGPRPSATTRRRLRSLRGPTGHRGGSPARGGR